MKVVLSSINVLDNWKTFIIHFFILPLLETLVFVAINYQITSTFNSELVVASLLLASGVTAINQMGASFTQDIIRGIDRDLVRKSPYNLYFWGSKFIVIFLFSLTLFLSNGLIFWLVGIDLNTLLKGLLLSPMIISFGLIVGLACSFLGWRLQNHYAFSNLLASLAMVLAGVMVPFYLYPPVFYQLTYLLPFARIIAIVFQESPSLKFILIDTIIALIWLLIGLITYHLQVKHITSFTRKGLL